MRIIVVVKSRNAIDKINVPESVAFVISKRFPCIMEKYGNVVITAPALLMLPNFGK